MRKILAFVLTLAVIAGMLTVPVGAKEAENELSVMEETLIGLGAADRETYNSDSYLSRAEFASVIASFCGLVPENRGYLKAVETSFGNDNKDELITSDSSRVFDDVDSTMKEYDAINAMYASGYMRGITSNLFGPHYDMTAAEAIKVLVSMLGRDYFAKYEGGYPKGYMEVARSIKLTSGLSLGENDFVTYKDVFTLIYNAFNIRVYEMTSVGADGEAEYTLSDKTFLEYCASIYTAEGNMTDNGITTYYAPSAVDRNMAVIGGVTMYTDNAGYVSGYLGRELTAYYRQDKSGKNHLIYAFGEEADTFSPDDFISYSSSAIKYHDKNGRIVTAPLSGANVIYNNTALDRYTEDTFRFLFGDITLVSTKGGSKYDIIIVNDYMTGKVNKIDKAGKKVYSDTLYKGMNTIKTLDLEEKDGKTVIITDSRGNIVDFDAVNVGDVIGVAKNADGSYINIRVCSASVPNFEVSDYSVSDVLTVSDGKSEYTLKGAGRLSETVVIKPGELYDLYLDTDGNLVYIEALLDSTNLKKAILTDVGHVSDGLDDIYAVKLYTQDGELSVYEMEEKVIINHSSLKSDKAISEIKNAVGKAVLYRVDNEKATLKAIVTPLELGANDSDKRGWYAVVPHIRLSAEEGESEADFKNYLNTTAIGNKFVFESNGNMLDKSLRYNEKIATLFAVPATKGEYDMEKRFYVNKLMMETNKGYWLNAYDTESDAIAPEVIVFSAGGGAASGDKVSERKAFVISKVVNTLNSDEEQSKAFKGFLLDADVGSVSEITVTLSTDAEFVDRENKVGAPRVELEAGDIIRYGTNSAGEISSLFVAYDMDKETAYPFATSSLDWYGGDTYSGYVYSIDGDYVRLTADEPHLVPVDANEQFAYFTTRDSSVVQSLGKKILVVEKTRGGVSVRQGTRDDIVSYKDTGDLGKGGYDRFVGIEYSWGYTIADVIYK